MIVVRRLVVAVLIVALSTACSSGARRTNTRRPNLRYTPTLVARDCAYSPPLRTRATCYWLDVPEDRAKPAGRTVRLAVTYLHSHAATPLPDPVVYLHGGPGGDAVATARNGFDVDSRLAKRDIVLYDQRGAGLSQPSLNCPEIEDAIKQRFERTDPFATELSARRNAVKRCHDRLVAQGIDLSQYDTDVSADDLDDLRQALHIGKWNLLGVSYGTRLALDEMRRHPQGVRSVLLDSTYPPQVKGVDHIVAGAERAFAKLAEGCAASFSCTRKYGNLRQLIDRAYNALNAHPYRGIANLGERDGIINLAVNGDDFIGGLYTALYDASLIPVLPSVINAIAHGDDGIIPTLAQQAIPFATSQSEGDYLSVECADNAVSDPNPSVGRYGVIVSESSAPYCDIWNVPREPGFAEPVRSDIPTLVLAGAYDPVTPPADGRDAARTLAHATYAELDGVGHAVIFSNKVCGSAMYRSFLDNPAAPDTSCASQQRSPTFS